MSSKLTILKRGSREGVPHSPRIIDLFSGAGGLSLGFTMSGFQILFALDSDLEVATSFSLNHRGSPVVVEDIQRIEPLQILEALRLDRSSIEGVVGGPPCQGFSTVGDRRLDDPRNALSWNFVLWVSRVLPRFFVMENVTGILSMKGGAVRREIVERFENLGYDTKIFVLLSAEYGVPQMRKRVFFVGTQGKNGIRIQQTHFQEKQARVFGDTMEGYVTVREAIGDLPSLESGGGEEVAQYDKEAQSAYQRMMREGSNDLTLHMVPRHGPLVLERIRRIPEGGNHSDLPESLRLKSGYPNIYGRLRWERPADTITGNCGCVSAPGRFIHPEDDRVISVREAARLQSFPDRFQFYGKLSNMYRQVGNAVPPLLAVAVAAGVRRWMEW